MTIEIHEPELEELIRERMETGHFRNVEDALTQALRISADLIPPTEASEPKKSLTQFLMESPLRGSDLQIERIEEYPRQIDL